MPYTLALHDIPMMLIQHHTSSAWYERGKDQFDRLDAEGAKNPRVMTLAAHSSFSSVPHRVNYLETVSHYLKGKPGVWFTTGEEIYAWYKSQK